MLVLAAAQKRSTTRRTACYRRTTSAENRLKSAAAQRCPGKLAMARCVKTPTKGSSQPALPLESGPGPQSPIKQPPRRRLGGAGCFRRCAPPRTEGLHDDLDGTPLRPRRRRRPSRPDPPRLMDAIAAYNKLVDAEEASSRSSD